LFPIIQGVIVHVDSNISKGPFGLAISSEKTIVIMGCGKANVSYMLWKSCKLFNLSISLEIIVNLFFPFIEKYKAESRTKVLRNCISFKFHPFNWYSGKIAH
jgi:hypothetical protein